MYTTVYRVRGDGDADSLMNDLHSKQFVYFIKFCLRIRFRFICAYCVHTTTRRAVVNCAWLPAHESQYRATIDYPGN